MRFLLLIALSALHLTMASSASAQSVGQQVEMDGAVASALHIATDDFRNSESKNLPCFTAQAAPHAADIDVHFIPKNMTIQQLPDDNIRIERHDRCGVGVSYTIAADGRIVAKWHMR